MRLEKLAYQFAIDAHAGQKRKVSGVDFVSHPIKVGSILKENGYRDEVIAAGYLHDVVEDTHFTLEDIKKEFGKDVASLVQSNTEKKIDRVGIPRPWKERKEETIAMIPLKSREEKALLIADKLANITDLLENIKIIYERKEKITDYFSSPIHEQIWYYETIASTLATTKELPSFFMEYEQKVKAFKRFGFGD